MRAVVQRVSRASVDVAGERVGEIQSGLLVYLGVGKGDTHAEIPKLLEKIVTLRIFENDAGRLDKSVLDIGGSLLVVSQFTLYADTRRGRRPGFDPAMPPDAARAAVDAFIAEARERLPVQTGRFGASMQVTSTNDGPITIWLDTADWSA